MVLPSLDEPGTFCPVCGELMRLEGFCGRCAERKLEAWPDETPLGLALGGYEEE